MLDIWGEKIFLEILIASGLGILAGIFTGLFPGVHINLVSVGLLSISGWLLGYVSALSLGAFIVAMAITHTFLDNIPSIFLGAPDSGTILNVLPGHRMLLQGKGYEAVKLATMGSLLGLGLVVVIIPVMAPGVSWFFPYLQKYMGWILLLVIGLMIFREKNRLVGLFLFLLSGVLGMEVLNSGIKQPLFPLLSGMFGIATLLVSLNEKVNIPEQKISEEKIEKGALTAAVGVSAISGSLVSLLPGVGASEAAIVGNELTRGKAGDKGFLVLVGGVNTVNMATSLLTFYALDKPRNGAIVVVRELIGKINFSEMMAFLGVTLLAGGIATILTLFLTKKFAKLISKVNYKKICLGVMGIVSLLVLVLSGGWGLLVMTVSTAVGLLPALLGVRRGLNMGCLLLPITLFFLI